MFETRCHCCNVQLSMSEALKRYNVALFVIVMAHCGRITQVSKLASHKKGSLLRLINELQRESLFTLVQNAHVQRTTQGFERMGSVKVGINTRMAEHNLIKEIPARLFDGANTWKYID